VVSVAIKDCEEEEEEEEEEEDFISTASS